MGCFLRLRCSLRCLRCLLLFPKCIGAIVCESFRRWPGFRKNVTISPRTYVSINRRKRVKVTLIAVFTSSSCLFLYGAGSLYRLGYHIYILNPVVWRCKHSTPTRLDHEYLVTYSCSLAPGSNETTARICNCIRNITALEVRTQLHCYFKIVRALDQAFHIYCQRSRSQYAPRGKMKINPPQQLRRCWHCYPRISSRQIHSYL